MEARLDMSSPWAKPAAPETLAELFCYLPTRRLRRELEAFRVDFEAEHGPTPLNQSFTSTLPTMTQTWLLQHHPERYFDGLPPFVRCFITAKMEDARHTGELDDMPASYLRLYLAGYMSRNNDMGL